MSGLKRSNNEETQLSNAMIQTVMRFNNLGSKRIFWSIVSQIEKGYGIQVDTNQDRWMTIPTRNLGLDRASKIESALEEITSVKNIKKWDHSDDDYSFSGGYMFPKWKYARGSGVIQLKVDGELIPLLAELSGGYAKIKMKCAFALPSTWAQRWYEIFAMKRPLHSSKYEWTGVEMHEIRTMLGIKDGEYTVRGSFLKRCIYTPIEQINKHTDLHIEYSPMLGISKPILGFDFVISESKTENLMNDLNKISKYVEDVKNLPSGQQATFLYELQVTYSLEPHEYEIIMENEDALHAVLGVHRKIENGTIKPQKGASIYMKGVIRKYIKS